MAGSPCSADARACRASASARIHHGGPPDRERAGGAAREGARPGVAAADPVDQLARRAAPVEMAVGALQSRREGRVLVALRSGRQRVELGERVHENVGAEHGEPRRQLARRLLRADRHRRRAQHGPGVHALVHLERGDARDGLAAHDRPLDRRGAAVARQQRAVDVDGSSPGRVEHRPRQDLAERDDDGHVGAERAQAIGPLGIAQPRRLEHLDARGQRARLDRRRGQALPAVRGPVGLGDDSDDLVAAQHRLERRQGKLGRAVEENSKARRRGGRRPRGDPLS